MRYLDPKNDLTFKKLFGEHPELLKSFLNALLPLPEGQEIVSLAYLPAEQVPEVPLFKNTIVDVRCTDNEGRQFIVEMQMLWTDSFKSRVLFNASKAYVRQLEKGGQYEALQPVYALSLVNEVYERDTEEFYHHFQIVNIQDTDMQLEGLEFVFIELPKFRPSRMSERRLAVLWLRLLTEVKDGTEEVAADLLNAPELQQSLQMLQESAFTREELEQYDRFWDAVSRERTLISAALKKGREIGAEEGERIGIEKGEKIGIEKGLRQKEEEKNREIIIRGHRNGLEVSMLVLLTGLSEEEVIRVLKESDESAQV